MWRTRGATPTPLATSRVITSGVNGRPALGISALPGLGGVDVLVHLDRPWPLDVAVADRSTVDGQPGEGRAGPAERVPPTDAPAGHRARSRVRLAPPRARGGAPAAGRSTARWSVRPVRRGSTTHLVASSRVDRWTTSGSSRRRRRRRWRRGWSPSVDHHQSPGSRNLGRKVKVLGTSDRVALVGDEHAHGVAGEPPCLGRLRRLESRWETRR